MSTELIASTSTDAPAFAAAPAANARFSIATASCSATSTPGTRSPYGAFSRVHPVRPAISTAARTFSLNSRPPGGMRHDPAFPGRHVPGMEVQRDQVNPGIRDRRDERVRLGVGRHHGLPRPPELNPVEPRGLSGARPAAPAAAR